MLTPRKNAILYYNPGTDFDEESGGDLLVRPAEKRAREKDRKNGEMEVAWGGGGLSGRLAPRIKVL